MKTESGSSYFGGLSVRLCFLFFANVKINVLHSTTTFVLIMFLKDTTMRIYMCFYSSSQNFFLILLE